MGDFMRYRNPIPVVDAIIEKESKLVLINRAIEPYKGKLAFPGGHVDYGETVEDATAREVKEETSLDVRLSDILGVYSEPGRDPREHRMTIVFVAEIIGGSLKAGSDARFAGFYDMRKLNKDDLAFDHFKIIEDYLKYKKHKGTYWSTRR